jgi:mannose-6-phosphate isomerase-like protein (cupin superfamily)
MSSEVGFGNRARVFGSKDIASTACGAVLEINAGKKTEMMFHVKNDKILYVLVGKLDVLVINDGVLKKKEFNRGESIAITPGLVHQLEAVENSIVIEFGTEPNAYRDLSDMFVVEKGTQPQPKELVLSEEDKARVEEAVEKAKEIVEAKKPKPVKKKTTKKKTTPRKKTTTKKKKLN